MKEVLKQRYAIFSRDFSAMYAGRLDPESKEGKHLATIVIAQELFSRCMDIEDPKKARETAEYFQKKILSVSKPSDQNDLYAVAFRFHAFRHLHQPAKTPVNPDEYGITLTWLDGAVVPGQQYPGVNPGAPDQKEEFEKKIGMSTIGWVQKNPGTKVYFSYGKHTAPGAVENMKVYFRNHLTPDEYKRLVFEDYSRVTPVLHRVFFSWYHADGAGSGRPGASPPHIIGLVDYKKIDDCWRRDERYSVCPDLDAEPMGLEEIFDHPTMQLLDKKGFVTAVSGPGGEKRGFENGFLIWNTGFPGLKPKVEDVVASAVDQLIRGKLPPSPDGSSWESSIFYGSLSALGRSMQSGGEFYPPVKPVELSPTGGWKR